MIHNTASTKNEETRKPLLCLFSLYSSTLLLLLLSYLSRTDSILTVHKTLPPPPLSIDQTIFTSNTACSSKTLQTSSFTIVLTPISFTVTTKSTSQIILKSLDSTSFSTLTGVSFQVSERHGNFNIAMPVENKLLFTTTKQTVTTFTKMNSTSVVIEGYLYLVDTVETLYTPIQYTFVITERSDSHVEYSFKTTPPPNIHTLAQFTFASHGDSEQLERYTGLGIQFSHVDFTGKKVPILVGEQGVGRGNSSLAVTMNRQFHGAGGNEFSTYAPLPLFLSSKFRAGYIRNTEYSFLDFTQQDRTTIEIVSSPIPNSILVSGGVALGKDFYDLLEIVTRDVTGRYGVPPSWSHSNGIIVGMQGGEAKVLQKLQKLLDANVAVAGLWIQDWSGRRVDSFGSRVLWNWELDSLYYPNWESMLSRLFLDHNIRVLAYVNPYLTTNLRKFKPHATRNLFAEAKQRGFLMTNSNSNSNSIGEVYIQSSASDEFKFGTVDLTNPTACEWYVDVILHCNLLCECRNANERWPFPEDLKEDEDDDDEVGGEFGGEKWPLQTIQCGNGGEVEKEDGGIAVSGWMADFGEYLPFDVTLHDGSSGHTAHSAFPSLWSSLNSFAIRTRARKSRTRDRDDTDLLFFSRSANLQSPGRSRDGGVMWVGDQNTAFDSHDGLKSAFTALITSSSSGLSLVHSDIGGYTSLVVTDEVTGEEHKVERSEELLMRWMELSAFCDVIFRSHEGNRADEQLQVWDTQRLLEAVKKWADFHILMAPLRRKLLRESSERGWPVVRGMWYDYGAKLYWGNREQVMIGKSLLFVPVVEEGANSVSVILPKIEGTKWVHFFTCKDYGTGTDTPLIVSAQLGEPAAFVPIRIDFDFSLLNPFENEKNEEFKHIKRMWRELDICHEYSRSFTSQLWFDAMNYLSKAMKAVVRKGTGTFRSLVRLSGGGEL